ncbi:nucleotide exchange factor GrpE [Silanimonas sp.]|uniref:nucleotide exchange factor GrpE n=1 Tax=Silanimonas sp. TaxID=1929290 RepID=UPI001BC04AD3|nr:nucleotide exchange factor GrpE [Silanimonas sp.]MBS3896233.1 nucleotide exchange factor GrpE [Silanimonas sp.]
MNHEHDPAAPATDTPGGAPTDGLDLAAENADLKIALAQLREDALRERAELENQRRRMARELENARRFANERLLGELLPVFDSLHAGLKAAGPEPHPLKEGLELTLRQLLKTAADNGLVEIDPKGEAFNPERHQAVTQSPSAEAAPGTVLEVFQRGYLLNERLLRPALVVVATDA